MLMVCAALAGFGGGGGDEAPAPPAPPPVVSNEVPASATVSATAYSQYAGGLAASDSTEPLDVDKVAAPSSETDEPIDVV
ncbi:MAG: hypothetical protein IPP87_15015 [Ideonella sp.]|nr:hypothetical protein [Ideonella sp.]